jgi:hypothetical protein
MNCKTVLASVLLLGLGQSIYGQHQPPPPPRQQPSTEADSNQQQGVEVLGRGPVHEAFAEPGNRDPQASTVIPKQPPPAVEEIPPEQAPPGDNMQWIPGYWSWDEDGSDFIWVSGVYRDVPPGRHWVPGYWNQIQGGYQWVAGYWADVSATDTQLLSPPPAPIEEAIPAAPDQASFYVPGCWLFVDNRYQWRNGFWSQHREGWVWTPESYVWTPAGFVFTGGYWDFDLRERGLLFAPVRFSGDYWTRSGWAFRPRCVITDTFLLGALFVREANRSYYFGDYFDPTYSRRGFVAWTDFRVGRGVDPLFGYYRAHFHDRTDWATNLEHQYALRRENPVERPARTWTDRVVRGGAREAQTGGIVPISRLGPSYTLKHLNPKQTEEFRGGTSRYRTFSAARGKLEAEHQRANNELRPATKPKERVGSAHEAEPRAPSAREPERQASPKAPVREAEPRTNPARQPEPRTNPPGREPQGNPARQPEPRTNPPGREPQGNPARQPEPRKSPPVREPQPHSNPAAQPRAAAPPRTIHLQSPNVGRPPVSTREAPIRTPPARPAVPNPEVRKK